MCRGEWITRNGDRSHRAPVGDVLVLKALYPCPGEAAKTQSHRRRVNARDASRKGL